MTIKVFSWQMNALIDLLGRKERLPHAVLVGGRTGIGTVEFARAIAQSLLCEQPADGGIACGECPACHWFGEGNHPDFREVLPDLLKEDAEVEASALSDTAKGEKKSAQITIDQIRELAPFITLTTHRAGWRVLLIHPAEAMNPAAANALLKTLEEPTPGTLIILVSSQPTRLLATVRSRCEKLILPFPEQHDAIAWLAENGVPEAATILAQAGGAPLLAREWADPEHQAQRRQLLGTLAEPDRADWLATAAAFEKADLKQVLFWLQSWCSDLILQKQTGKSRHHPDFAAALGPLAARAAATALFKYEATLRLARRHIQHPLNARLLLEHLLLSYGDAVHD